MSTFLVISYLISAAIAVVIMLFTLSIAYKYSLFDTVDGRKIHTGRIPRLGGVAIFLASLITITLLWCLSKFINSIGDLNLYASQDNSVLLVLYGATILFGFGVCDDLKGLRYRTKFIAQIAAGLLMCYSGTWLNHLYGLFGLSDTLPVWGGYVITIFAILLITNAINFIDGIDGLASGLCAMCLLIYLVVSLCLHDYWLALLCVVLLGAISAFMAFNLKGKPEKHKKIFMGDTGSLVLSFMIGYIGVSLCTNPAITTWSINPFVLIFSPLLLPCLDVVRVVGVRLYQRRNPFLADKSHIHHMLLEINDKNQTKTLIQVLLLSVILIAVSILLSIIFNINLVFNFVIILWIFIMITISRKLKIKKHKNNEN